MKQYRHQLVKDNNLQYYAVCWKDKENTLPIIEDKIKEINQSLVISYCTYGRFEIENLLLRGSRVKLQRGDMLVFTFEGTDFKSITTWSRNEFDKTFVEVTTPKESVLDREEREQQENYKKHLDNINSALEGYDIINPLDHVVISEGRRKGNTTKIADKIIQLLFEGHTVAVLDHVKNGCASDNNKRLFGIVINRLKKEHAEHTFKAYAVNSDQPHGRFSALSIVRF